jgi:hypothetical protein
MPAGRHGSHHFLTPRTRFGVIYRVWSARTIHDPHDFDIPLQLGHGGGIEELGTTSCEAATAPIHLAKDDQGSEASTV